MKTYVAEWLGRPFRPLEDLTFRATDISEPTQLFNIPDAQVAIFQNVFHNGFWYNQGTLEAAFPAALYEVDAEGQKTYLDDYWIVADNYLKVATLYALLVTDAESPWSEAQWISAAAAAGSYATNVGLKLDELSPLARIDAWLHLLQYQVPWAAYVGTLPSNETYRPNPEAEEGDPENVLISKAIHYMDGSDLWIRAHGLSLDPDPPSVEERDEAIAAVEAETKLPYRFADYDNISQHWH